ncbi:hypothetical protein T439DRAFT_324521 [Meredithblackwellia eburnea MCA 4105]
MSFGGAKPFASFGGALPAPGGSAPSLFGQPAQAQTQPTASTSLFGAPATSTASAAPSLFGASAPAQSTTTTPSLFGQTAQPASTPSLFSGLTSQPQSAPATTNLFGQPAQQQSTTPSLFGAQSTSLFGAPAQTAAPTSATGLFGQPQQQQQQQQVQQNTPQSQTQPAPFSFGMSQSAATASLFGSKPPTAPNSTTSLFGAPSSSLSFSATPSATVTQQPLPKLGDPYPPPDPNEAPIESRLAAIKDAWDPQNPKCRFQTYFYNVPTAPNTVAQYRSPPPGADEKAWLKAVRENPDPDHLVPALAVGFPSIQKRIEHQTRQSQAHQARLKEIHDHLSTLSSTHSLTTSLRTLRASQNAAALSSRLLALVAKTSALSPNRNMSVRKEEEDLRVSLEAMKHDVEGISGRGNELWAGVGALKARRLEGEKTEWAVVDEDGLRQVLEILASQQAGLDHLTRTLNAASQDVDVMKAAFGLATKGDGAPGK